MGDQVNRISPPTEHSVVCFLKRIENFEREGDRAERYIGDRTTRWSDVRVFITSRHDDLYVHSNFVLGDARYPTKLCTNGDYPLKALLENLVTSQGILDAQNRRSEFERAFLESFVFFIDERVLSDKFSQLNFDDLKNCFVISEAWPGQIPMETYRRVGGPHRSQYGNDRHVVVLVHGINTRAQWLSSVKPVLEKAGLIVAPAGYDVYGLLRFLLPFDWPRRRAVERVRTRVKTAIAVHRPDRLSVIAHSFGSYIVARLIAEDFDIRWHRVVFCGSVNAQSFPFEQYLSRFDAPIMNEIGTKDVLPAFAERVTWGYGAIGTYGAQTAAVEERWHAGLGHSGFLRPSFCRKYWVTWLCEGKIVPGATDPKPLSAATRLLLRVPWRWVIVAAGLAVLAVLARWFWPLWVEVFGFTLSLG